MGGRKGKKGGGRIGTKVYSNIAQPIDRKAKDTEGGRMGTSW